MSQTLNQTENKFAAQDLIKPDNCLSAIRQRRFFQKQSFATKDEAKAVLTDAKSVIPETKSAYIASGRTTVSSVIGILLLSPVILVLIIALIFGIGYIDSWLSGSLSSSSYSTRRHLGTLALILDLLIVVVMVIIPAFSFRLVSIAFKNRNRKIPSIAAYIVTLVAALFAFLPIWNGSTIAPVDITFFFIPVRWLFIIIGILLVPFVTSIIVSDSISNLKFCEETGVFLKNTRTKYLDFDYIENALELLKMKQYSRILSLSESSGKSHCGRMRLFSHRMANCAYLDIEACFSGKGGQGNSSFNENATWLVFSEKLPSDIAKNILTA
jgi:hypothetical protein